MPRSWLLTVDGKHEVVDWAHEEVSAMMGGTITFVGAIDDLQVFVLALTYSDKLYVNPFCTDCDVFMHLPVRGPVIFIATDKDGDPIDVDVEAVKSHLHITI